MANETTTSNVVAGVNTYYNKRLRRVLKETVRIVPLGQEQPLPKGAGKTMEWFEWNKIPVTLTTGVVDAKIATEGADPTAKTLTGMKRQATLVEYGDYSKLTRILKNTHIDTQIKGASALYGAYAAEVFDLITQQAIVSGGAMPVRADLDATYSHSGTFTTVTNATDMADTTLTGDFGGANDDLNMAVIYITSGSQKGTGGTVTTYLTAGGDMSVVAGLDAAPAVGDSYTVVSPAALSSATASNADSLNTAQIRRGMRLLKQHDAMPMGSDGFFAGVFSPEAEEGLMADSNWTNVSEYSAQVEGKGGGLFKGEVGRWGGVRWVRTTMPFKALTQADPALVGTTGGVGAAGINYSAASYAEGAGFTVSYIFGKDSFGTVKFDGFSGRNAAPKIIIKTPNEHDTSNPLNMRSTVGFYGAYTTRVLQSLNVVQLWSAEPQL
jgi:N4-gp56 family major capsid protein